MGSLDKNHVLIQLVRRQKESMVPFEYVHRCIEGRVASILRLYNKTKTI